MIAYSTDYDPPALVVSMTVASTINRRLRQTWPALIDTGSDITAIPEEVIERLDLYEIRRLQFEDLHGTTSLIFTYKARLIIADLVIPEIEIITTGLEIAIVGRDVLSRFNLHCYGSQQQFELNA